MMQDLGRGLATLGIWLGIGMIGWNMPTAAIMPAFLAMIATFAVWVGTWDKTQ